jgi:acyl-CoA reductase-like NAD-dependent aldehyde dehydrogenase
MEYALHIGGDYVRTGELRVVELPYDGSVVAKVHQASAVQVEAAVRAAKAAANAMREMAPAGRSAILRKAWSMLLERKEELAEAVSSECGKPLREARAEVDRASYTLLFSAEEADRLCGEAVPIEASPAGKGHMAMTVREPVGVIAAITPFNFPLNLSMHKIGPALAAGNTVVHKPASSTPLSALKLVDLFEAAGLPKGALNVIPGPGGVIGDLLSMHPDVSMITFTGSAEVGLRIRSLAGLKRVTLELGNNSAVIVAEDADLDAALPRCIAGSYAHSGQVCISIQRILVEDGIREEFTRRFVEGVSNLKLGHPLDPATDISSLITVGEAQRVEAWVADAVRDGARLIAGGKRRRATIEPAVLTSVPEHSAVYSREAFGPLVCINAFSTLEVAIEKVNASDYGLQAGIFTRDIERAFRAARGVHVGGFLINEGPQFRVDQMPYGGVKMSGSGREGPRYAIEEMTEPKLICWRV